jgi:hypothetical protein
MSSEKYESYKLDMLNNIVLEQGSLVKRTYKCPTTDIWYGNFQHKLIKAMSGKYVVYTPLIEYCKQTYPVLFDKLKHRAIKQNVHAKMKILNDLIMNGYIDNDDQRVRHKPVPVKYVFDDLNIGDFQCRLRLSIGDDTSKYYRKHLSTWEELYPKTFEILRGDERLKALMYRPAQPSEHDPTENYVDDYDSEEYDSDIDLT